MPEPDQPVVEAPVETPSEPAKAPAKFEFNPTRPLSQQVDKLLDSLPSEEEKEEKKDDAKSEKASGEEKSKETEEKEESTGSEDSQTESEEAVQQPDEGPDISELDNEPEPVELPEWGQYVYDGLPTLEVLGHTVNAAGEPGKDKIFKVKTVQELPDDFQFASKRDEIAFNAAIAGQEVNARELLQKYQAEQQRNQYIELQQQEAVEIQKDIRQLQRDGLLPKFQYEDTDPKFNSDPAVQEANQIYDIYQKTNEAYIKQGRTYRISYADAADKYYAQKARNERNRPEEKPKEKAEVKETKADAERKQVAEKVSSRGAEPSNSQRPKAYPGMKMSDIVRLVNQGRI